MITRWALNNSMLVLILVLLYFFRGNLLGDVAGPGVDPGFPLPAPQAGPAGPAGFEPGVPPTRSSPAEEELVDFVSFVLDDLRARVAFGALGIASDLEADHRAEPFHVPGGDRVPWVIGEPWVPDGGDLGVLHEPLRQQSGVVLSALQAHRKGP